MSLQVTQSTLHLANHTLSLEGSVERSISMQVRRRFVTWEWCKPAPSPYPKQPAGRVGIRFMVIANEIGVAPHHPARLSGGHCKPPALADPAGRVGLLPPPARQELRCFCCTHHCTPQTQLQERRLAVVPVEIPQQT